MIKLARLKLDITRQNILLAFITAIVFSLGFVLITNHRTSVSFAFCLAIAAPYSRLLFSRRNKQIVNTVEIEDDKNLVTFEKSDSINKHEYKKYWIFLAVVYTIVFILYKSFPEKQLVRASLILTGVLLTTAYLFIKKIPTRKSDFHANLDSDLFPEVQSMSENTYVPHQWSEPHAGLLNYKSTEHQTAPDPTAYGSSVYNYTNLNR